MFVPQGIKVQLDIPTDNIMSIEMRESIIALQNSSTPFGVTIDIDDTDEKITPYLLEVMKGIRQTIANLQTARPTDSRIIRPGDLKQ